MAARKTLRFINGNFRAQGYQGSSFQKWPANKRKGTILIKRGHLRRSFRQQIAPGGVRTWSESPYARIHNEGFSGTVSVKAHTRSKYKAQKVGTGRFTKTGKERMRTVHTLSGSHAVSAHSRKVAMPKRQFMPTGSGDAGTLIKSIERDVVKKLQTIFS